MIELAGDRMHLLRRLPKENTISVKRIHRTSGATSQREEPKEEAKTLTQNVEGKETEAKGTPSVINFQYLPSGKIRLNQEDRQHILDFFE